MPRVREGGGLGWMEGRVRRRRSCGRLSEWMTLLIQQEERPYEESCEEDAESSPEERCSEDVGFVGHDLGEDLRETWARWVVG